MVQDDTDSSGPYAGAGTTGPFVIGFRFLENSHIQAIQTAASVETALVLNVDYTVTGAGASSGGTLTLTVALPLGQTLTINRLVPATQLTDYTQSDSFPAESHEDALDKLTMLAQQLQRGVDQSIRVPERATTLPTLPAAAQRIGMTLGFDGAGNPTVLIPTSGSAAAVLTQLALSIGTSLIGFIQAGVGAVLRTLQSKLRETVSVTDYGAVIGTSTDSTTYIQAAITANPGKTIVFPGNFKITARLWVQADGTRLAGIGASSGVTQFTANIDSVLFAPSTFGTSAAFLNNVGIEHMSITHDSTVAAVHTSGAGVRFTQCNGYRADAITINDAFEGLTVMGGQNGELSRLNLFASQGSYAGARSALLHFRQAPIGGGLYQPCYTVRLGGYFMSATKLRDACVLVSNGDGIAIDRGYMAYALTSLVVVMAERDNSYVAALSLTASYLDCVSMTTGTLNGIELRADGLAASFIYSMFYGDDCVIGNAVQRGIIGRKPETGGLTLNGKVINTTLWGVDIQGSTTLTNVFLNGSFSSCGDGTSGAVRLNTIRSYKLSANFDFTTNVCLNTSGTIGQGTICGSQNNSNVADMTNAATYTNGFEMSGNTSAYTGATTWRNPQGSAVVDPANVANGASTSGTITATGAALGDTAIATFSLSLQGMNLSAFVSAANTVTWVLTNNTGGALDLASGTMRVKVTKATN